MPHLKENNLWTTVLLMLVRCMAHVSIRVETLLEMKIQFLLDLLATLLAKKPQHQCYHLINTYTKKKRGKNLAKTNVLLCCDNQCLLCLFFQHAHGGGHSKCGKCWILELKSRWIRPKSLVYFLGNQLGNTKWGFLMMR